MLLKMAAAGCASTRGSRSRSPQDRHAQLMMQRFALGDSIFIHRRFSLLRTLGCPSTFSLYPSRAYISVHHILSYTVPESNKLQYVCVYIVIRLIHPDSILSSDRSPHLNRSFCDRTADGSAEGKTPIQAVLTYSVRKYHSDVTHISIAIRIAA